MAFRLPIRKIEPKAKPVKDKGYLSWVHQLPCIITGTSPVEAAHLSTGNAMYGHSGRGMGQKASDRWALPLCPEKHREQHEGNEIVFWYRHGIDPYKMALILHGLYCEGNLDLALTVVKIQAAARRDNDYV